MTTENPLEVSSSIESELAVDRLACAMLKLETSTDSGAGGLDAIRAMMSLPIQFAEGIDEQDVASVLRRFVDVVDAVQADLRTAIANG